MQVTASDGSCRLDAPSGWIELAPAPGGAVLATIEPSCGRSFRSNAVITRDADAGADEPLAAVARRHLAELAAVLHGYRAVEVRVDADEVRLRGLHLARGVGLAVCQWARRTGDGRLLVLSVTVAALDLPALSPTVDEVAASWEVTA